MPQQIDAKSTAASGRQKAGYLTLRCVRSEVLASPSQKPGLGQHRVGTGGQTNPSIGLMSTSLRTSDQGAPDRSQSIARSRIAGRRIAARGVTTARACSRQRQARSGELVRYRLSGRSGLRAGLVVVHEGLDHTRPAPGTRALTPIASGHFAGEVSYRGPDRAGTSAVPRGPR